jgi:hypothetical protein
VLFDNLTKTIAYTLSHLPAELFAVVIRILFDVPYGMTSLMILSIDLLTEVRPWTAALFLPSGLWDKPWGTALAGCRWRLRRRTRGSPRRATSWPACRATPRRTGSSARPSSVRHRDSTPFPHPLRPA